MATFSSGCNLLVSFTLVASSTLALPLRLGSSHLVSQPYPSVQTSSGNGRSYGLGFASGNRLARDAYKKHEDPCERKNKDGKEEDRWKADSAPRISQAPPNIGSDSEGPKVRTASSGRRPAPDTMPLWGGPARPLCLTVGGHPRSLDGAAPVH
ncbi:hypothetical protein DFH08DRAFT_962217 [Mycena albidolilacea]|uniref:Uncharacterized protein n=1 Tax=Mycena albidolilacea TaxID=1033008 RepID=A0AAD7EQ78_9AGAR|nr:hypothetical protein DFH08DRAFT_962217 [Mycena albidolilacea]